MISITPQCVPPSTISAPTCAAARATPGEEVTEARLGGRLELGGCPTNDDHRTRQAQIESFDQVGGGVGAGLVDDAGRTVARYGTRHSIHTSTSPPEWVFRRHASPQTGRPHDGGEGDG